MQEGIQLTVNKYPETLKVALTVTGEYVACSYSPSSRGRGAAPFPHTGAVPHLPECPAGSPAPAAMGVESPEGVFIRTGGELHRLPSTALDGATLAAPDPLHGACGDACMAVWQGQLSAAS